MRVLDLFSGIGGFALGLHRAGMTTAAFCERDDFCRRVLAKHWPEIPIYDDVRTLTAARLRADGIGPVHAIVGGFPCQPFSVAGKRKGTSDERHLWPEFARLIGGIRPRWVIGENVPGIRTSAADLVMGDLEALDYACGAFVVGADDVAAPHRRKRVWFLAYCDSLRRDGGREAAGCEARPGAGPQRGGADVAHAAGDRLHQQRGERGEQGGAGQRRDQPADRDQAAMGHAQDDRLAFRRRLGRHLLIELEAAHRAGGAINWPRWRAEPYMGGAADGPPAGLDEPGMTWPTPCAADSRGSSGEQVQLVDAMRAERAAFHIEPWERDVPRVIPRGSPNRTSRLKALGNAVVPQVVEAIGRAVLRADKEMA